MKQPGSRNRSRMGETGFILGRKACAFIVALALWLGADLPQKGGATRDLPTAALAEDALPVATAEIYQYTDAQGVIHFVDTPEKVPPLYRSRLIVRRDIPSPLPQTTPVKVADNQILVPVVLKHGDKRVQALFLLDTGSALTCVTEALAASLGLSPTAMRIVAMGLADGSTIEFRIAQIDAVVVGERSKSPLEIGILPHSDMSELHDGLLGLDFFKDFRYQIDVAQGVIRWR